MSLFTENKKKILCFAFICLTAIAVCLALAASFAYAQDEQGINNNNANNNQDSAPATTSPTSNSSSLNLIKNNTLTVAVSPDYPPFTELVNDRIEGYEPDIYHEIARRLGLNIDEKIMNFDAIITSVASGEQCDIGMAGISKNSDRAKIVDFSESYYTADLSFVVNQDSSINKSNAKSKLYDKSLRFAVQSGTTSEDYVRENFGDAKCIAYSNSNDCFAALLAGQADVVCATSAVCNSMLKGTYSSLNEVYDVATGEEYGIIVNKDNSALLNSINSCLNDMKNDGTLQTFADNNHISNDTNSQAYSKSLQTVKCSAKVNSLASNDIISGKETRITWEGQAGESEVLTGLSFTLPQGTQFDSDQCQATLLSGPDLTDRTVLDTTISAQDSTINIDFCSAYQIKAAGYFRVEIYGVVFPENLDGKATINGSYKLTDGSVHPINDIAPIEVRNPSIVEEFAYYIDQLPAVIAWNSNQFCNLFLNPSIFLLSIPVIFNGFLMALAIVLCAFPLAIPLGLIFALMRLSKYRVLRAIASTYVNIIRGTPLFLQIYIAFFGLPLAGINIPNFPLGLIVLAINSSAYLCEIFRAGIQSVPKGQFEASLSLGMNKTKTMAYIILPQAFQRCIPTMTSEFILLFKDTSLLASVGVMEVVMFAKTIVASTGSITPYIVAALFYLLITLPLSKFVGKLEKKCSRSRKDSNNKTNTKLSRDAYKNTISVGKVFPGGMDESKAFKSETFGSV